MTEILLALPEGVENDLIEWTKKSGLSKRGVCRIALLEYFEKHKN